MTTHTDLHNLMDRLLEEKARAESQFRNAMADVVRRAQGAVAAYEAGRLLNPLGELQSAGPQADASVGMLAQVCTTIKLVQTQIDKE